MVFKDINMIEYYWQTHIRNGYTLNRMVFTKKKKKKSERYKHDRIVLASMLPKLYTLVKIYRSIIGTDMCNTEWHLLIENRNSIIMIYFYWQIHNRHGCRHYQILLTNWK
jgi:hypothetical protein